jgi:hypothetical protein
VIAAIGVRGAITVDIAARSGRCTVAVDVSAAFAATFEQAFLASSGAITPATTASSPTAPAATTTPGALTLRAALATCHTLSPRRTSHTGCAGKRRHAADVSTGCRSINAGATRSACS